jgi:hypothetical protein
MAVNIEVCSCIAGCAGVGLTGDASAVVSAWYEGWAGFAKLSLDWVARPPALIEHPEVLVINADRSPSRPRGFLAGCVVSKPPVERWVLRCDRECREAI